MINNGMKAKIHIAKTQVGMTDDEYKSLLSSVGATSCVELNKYTFDKVMRTFKSLGFKGLSKSKKKRNIRNLPDGKKKIMSKLEAIILDMDLSWAYVDSIAKRRFGADTVQWLKTEDLYKVLQMMISHQSRHPKKAGA
jgi:phage gp16-like protein